MQQDTPLPFANQVAVATEVAVASHGGSVGEASPAAAPASPSHIQFEFTGNVREYFGIWLVNSLLSLLTLGVYSAWAKVVQRRYFYRNTWLAGASFEYLADPRRVLLGRALIVSVLGVLVFAKYYSVYFYLGALAMAALLAPWAFVLALRFNARNSSYRGVRFAFHGRGKESYARFVLTLLGYVACGLGYPWARHRLTRFVTTSHGFGNQRFQWLAEASQYYSVYLLSLALLVPGLAVFIGVIVARAPDLATLTSLLFYAYLLVPAAFLKAGLANLVYGELRLSGHAFRCNQQFGTLLGLYATNLLAVALSAGLLIPWAQIRMARFRASALALVPAGDIDVQAAPGDGGTAFGDAATDIGGLNLDLGL